MSMRPYAHQLRALEFCRLRERSLIQMPAGAGKSYILRRLAVENLRHRSVYIACPSQEILQQHRLEALKEGMLPVVDKADYVASPHARLTIGTFQTMVNRIQKYKSSDAIALIDECHHVNYKAPEYSRLSNYFERVVGFSATPWSEGCAEFFANQIFTYGLSESVLNGTNAKFELREWSNPNAGFYQLIFASGGDEAKNLCRTLPQSAYAIYSLKDARQQIERFRRGIVGTMFVNRMLMEGFDLPQIKSIWIARNTSSPIAAMQMLGRALRPWKNRTARIYVRTELTHKTIERALSLAG